MRDGTKEYYVCQVLCAEFPELRCHEDAEPCGTMRFGSTAKVLLKCKLKYYRISECAGFVEAVIIDQIAASSRHWQQV